MSSAALPNNGEVRRWLALYHNPYNEVYVGRSRRLNYYPIYLEFDPKRGYKPHHEKQAEARTDQ
jgi:hypothetical protein